MAERLLAISDIHGCLDEFKELLEKVKYDPEHDELILLGDYMDRGPESRAVGYLVKELVEKNGAVALRGNHDAFFTDWLKDPVTEMSRFVIFGGLETIRAFLGRDDIEMGDETDWMRWAQQISEENESLITFLEHLPLYEERNEFLFVHAGINPQLADWKDTSGHDFIWIRDAFLDVDYPSEDKTIVHGHTPTMNLHGSPDVFFGKGKIGIDGGCAYGGQLNCLEVQAGEMRTYAIPHKKQ